MPSDVPLPAPPPFVDRWTNYEVPMLAQILAADLESGFERALAWGTVGGIMRDAADTLVRVVGVLSETWDPAVDQAAERFVQEAEILVVRLRSVADDAAANKPVVNRAVTSFESSRAEVLRLHDSWIGIEAQERASTYRAGALAANDRGEWREAYNDRAYEVLERSDTEVFQEARALVVPSSEQREPLIPVLVADPVEHGPSNRIGNGDDWFIGTNGRMVRPVSGVEAIPPRGGLSIGTPTPGGSKGGIGNGVAIPGVSNFTPTGTIGSESSDHLGRDATLIDPTERRAKPGLHAEHAGSTERDSQPTRPDGHTQSERSTIGGVPMIGGLRSTASGRRRLIRSRNVDSGAWQIAKGVPGVLMPSSSEPTHDPGGGVIGIDR